MEIGKKAKEQKEQKRSYNVFHVKRSEGKNLMIPNKKNTKLKINPMDFSRPIKYTKSTSDSDLAFTDIEDSAEYGKQLRASAWNRHHPAKACSGK